MAEETNTPSIPAPAANKKSSKTAHVPTKDLDMASVAETAAAKWVATPALTLLYKTSDVFQLEAKAYSKSLKDRVEAGTDRPNVTGRLKVLDGEINKGVKFVRNYLAEDFDDQDTKQYPKYGIEKVGTTYGLPNDRNKRVPALDLLLKGIKDGGYDSKKYGKTYFTARIAEYKTLFTLAGSTDGNISEKVGEKNEQKENIRQVLTSLIFILKGNYPKTYSSVLRGWGFQKEKY